MIGGSKRHDPPRQEAPPHPGSLSRHKSHLGMGGGTLTYSHTVCMVNHMKTTLNIDRSVMALLKREAVRQGRTMSELVETALRLFFQSPKKGRRGFPPLPTFRSGGHLVDIANREALYHAMEGQ
jgi:hypothetical protein